MSPTGNNHLKPMVISDAPSAFGHQNNPTVLPPSVVCHSRATGADFAAEMEAKAKNVEVDGKSTNEDKVGQGGNEPVPNEVFGEDEVTNNGDAVEDLDETTLADAGAALLGDYCDSFRPGAMNQGGDELTANDDNCGQDDETNHRGDNGSKDDMTKGDALDESHLGATNQGVEELIVNNDNCGEDDETNHSGDKPVGDKDHGSEDDETKGDILDKSHPGAMNLVGSEDDEMIGDTMDKSRPGVTNQGIDDLSANNDKCCEDAETKPWGDKPVADEDNGSVDDETKGDARDQSHLRATNQGSEDDETIGDAMDESCPNQGVNEHTANNENCGEDDETNYWGDKPVADEDNGSVDEETKGDARDQSHSPVMNQGSEDDETIGDGIDKLTAINENCGEHYETNYSGDKPAVDEDVGSEDDEDESHPGGTNQGSDEDETKDDEESYDNDDDLGDSVVEDSSSDDDTVGRDNSFLPTDKVNADDAEDIQDDGPLLSFDGKTVTLKPAPRIETRMVYTNGFNVTYSDTMRAHVESRKRKKSCNYTPSYQLTWLLMRMGRCPKPHFYIW